MSIGIMSAAVGYRVIVHMSADAKLYEYMRDLLETEEIFLEPSACAAFQGPVCFGRSEELKGLCEGKRSGRTDGAGGAYRLGDGRKPGAGRDPGRIPADVSGLNKNMNIWRLR